MQGDLRVVLGDIVAHHHQRRVVARYGARVPRALVPFVLLHHLRGAMMGGEGGEGR